MKKFTIEKIQIPTTLIKCTCSSERIALAQYKDFNADDKTKIGILFCVDCGNFEKIPWDEYVKLRAG